MRQAESDLKIGNAILSPSDEQTYCHAIAKFQQAVEKAIKGVAAALRDKNGWRVKIGCHHPVAEWASGMRRFPGCPPDVQRKLKKLFDERLGEIKSLDALVPKQPGEDELACLNTEYPYQDARGNWRTPCDAGSFDWVRDVRRFGERLAVKVVAESAKVISRLIRPLDG